MAHNTTIEPAKADGTQILEQARNNEPSPTPRVVVVTNEPLSVAYTTFGSLRLEWPGMNCVGIITLPQPTQPKKAIKTAWRNHLWSMVKYAICFHFFRYIFSFVLRWYWPSSKDVLRLRGGGPQRLSQNKENQKLFVEFCRERKCDLLLSFGGGYIPNDVLEADGVATWAKWNMHPGYLPGHAGYDPWKSYFLDCIQKREDDPKYVTPPSALTIHCLEKKLDGGNVVRVWVQPSAPKTVFEMASWAFLHCGSFVSDTVQSHWKAHQQADIKDKAISISYVSQESNDFKVVTNKMIWENMGEIVSVGGYNLTWRYFNDLSDYLTRNVLGWKKKRSDYYKCGEDQLGAPWRGD